MQADGPSASASPPWITALTRANPCSSQCDEDSSGLARAERGVRDTASGLSRGGLPNFFAFRIEPFAGCAGPA
jgi:hypothetical protein